MPKQSRRRRRHGTLTPPRSKVPVYVDRDVPEQIVRDVRQNESDDVRLVGVAAPHMDDRAVWREAVQGDAILTTRDEGFWNDSAYPLRESPGLIIVKGRTAHDVGLALAKLSTAIGFLEMERLADGFFRQTKFKASRQGLTAKFLTHDSRKVVRSFSYGLDGDEALVALIERGFRSRP